MKKKAFTLAEVLVALGIIGIIAALTLPSLSKLKSDSGTGPLLAKAMATLEDGIGRLILEDPYTPLSKYVADGEFLGKLEKHMIWTSTDAGYRLKDGVVVSFAEPTAGSVVGVGTALKDVNIDINGKASPNTTGIDKFRFVLSSQGLLIPQGHAAKIASNNWKIPKDYDGGNWGDFKLGDKFECNKTCDEAAGETLNLATCMCESKQQPAPPKDPCRSQTWHPTCQACSSEKGVYSVNEGLTFGDCKKCEGGKEVADTTSEGCQENLCANKTWHPTCQTCDSKTGDVTAINEGAALDGCKKCEGGQEVDDTSSTRTGCCPDPGTGNQNQTWDKDSCSYSCNLTISSCEVGYKPKSDTCTCEFNRCPAGYEQTTLPSGKITCLKLAEYVCTQAEIAAHNKTCVSDKVKCQDGTIAEYSRVDADPCPNDRKPYCCDFERPELVGLSCMDGNSWTQDCGGTTSSGGGGGGGGRTDQFMQEEANPYTEVGFDENGNPYSETKYNIIQ